MRFFALKGSEQLGATVARSLAIDLDPHEERDFEDGEHKARPLVSVRGKDIYVLHSLAGGGGVSANDKLCKLLFFLATCKENGAARATAVVPYLAYARKDRQTKARDPVTTRYVAQLFEAMGTDRIVTLDVHNLSAFQNAFRCESIHLDTRKHFAPPIGKLAGDLPVTIFSPDGGGVKRAQLLKEALEAETGKEVSFGFMEKRRSRNVVSGELFAGDVADNAVFIVDDMISSGGTMLRAALACRERGARAVHAIATHGLFGKGADVLFGSRAIDRIIVTDSIDAATAAKVLHPQAPLDILPIGRLISMAIRRLHTPGSISELIGIED
ncbi:ribose-phosphate diphosphokinase [Mesorhizobium jarvisii]|uniref:ribose-phosphate diphosphokinase n=1 Tax=Mesorhizobium jarvisii TaxID=1777867 RepID=UPI001F0A28FB|nr:ribose-phosphate diphosphokinase [Mesorhizobium jarvisii]MCH4559152.1 ribose-phosphate diphosphokinase [Mesorhizobium jarvisii]